MSEPIAHCYFFCSNGFGYSIPLTLDANGYYHGVWLTPDAVEIVDIKLQVYNSPMFSPPRIKKTIEGYGLLEKGHQVDIGGLINFIPDSDGSTE